VGFFRGRAFKADDGAIRRILDGNQLPMLSPQFFPRPEPVADIGRRRTSIFMPQLIGAMGNLREGRFPSPRLSNHRLYPWLAHSVDIGAEIQK
jgi:hypothetical protein